LRSRDLIGGIANIQAGYVSTFLGKAQSASLSNPTARAGNNGDMLHKASKFHNFLHSSANRKNYVIKFSG
jgi:hypothetical protein